MENAGNAPPESRPKATIGIPVYNGERYLREAIESALAQDFSDFEILISDNGSTDSTAEICTEFAGRDARIRYIHQPTNRGAHWNFRFVASEAHGELFTWLAHDDALEPGFLRQCLEHFQTNDALVLVSGDFTVVDASGSFLEDAQLVAIRDDISWPRRRDEFFKYPISNVFYCIYGLMKIAACREMLATLPVPKLLTGSELPVLARLASFGEIASIPYPLRRYRSHSQSAYFQEISGASRGSASLTYARRVANQNRLRVDQVSVLVGAAIPFPEKLAAMARLSGFYLVFLAGKAIRAPRVIFKKMMA